MRSTHAWMWVAALMAVLFQPSSGVLPVTSKIVAFELGRPFKFYCSLPNPEGWNLLSVKQMNLQIWRKNLNGEQLLLKQFINRSFVTASGEVNFATDLDDRDHLSFKTQNQTFSLIKSKSACSDDGDEYKCVLAANYPGYPAPTVVNDSEHIYLRARPRKPQLIQPSSSVEENGNIKIGCVGNVGDPGKGEIKWKLAVPGMAPDTLDVDDPRVETKRAQGHPPCTEEHLSTLTLTEVNRKYQNVTLTCFMSHLDFRPDIDMGCRFPDEQLCENSSPIAVYYPVTSVSLSLLEPLRDAGAVTLVCRADAVPAPQFIWGPKVNRLQQWLVSDAGNESRATLASFRLDSDAGQYSCTAKNAYNGKYFAKTANLRLDESLVKIRKAMAKANSVQLSWWSVAASVMTVMTCWCPSLGRSG